MRRIGRVQLSLVVGAGGCLDSEQPLIKSRTWNCMTERIIKENPKQTLTNQSVCSTFYLFLTPSLGPRLRLWRSCRGMQGSRKAGVKVNIPADQSETRITFPIRNALHYHTNVTNFIDSLHLYNPPIQILGFCVTLNMKSTVLVKFCFMKTSAPASKRIRNRSPCHCCF